MAEDIVVNGVTYNGVDSIAMTNKEGKSVQYFADAVRYMAQTLTEDQKAQARANIGAASSKEVNQLSETIADQHKIKTMTRTEYNATSVEDFEAMYESGVRIIGIADGYSNLVPLSTNEAGITYCGCGYRNEYRIKSDGTIVTAENTCISGYMPYRHGAMVRVIGSSGESALTTGGQYVAVYGSDFSVIEVALQSALVSQGKATWKSRNDGLYELTIDTSKVSAWNGAAYMRVSNCDCVGSDMIVTLDETIAEVYHE